MQISIEDLIPNVKHRDGNILTKVDVHERFNNNIKTIITHTYTNEKGVDYYFFSDNHTFGSEMLWKYFCPCSTSLPHSVVARPGVENGVVDSLKKYMDVYHSKSVLIESIHDLVDFFNTQILNLPINTNIDEMEECQTCGSLQHSGGCIGSFTDAPLQPCINDIPDIDLDEEKKNAEYIQEALKRFFAGELPTFSTGAWCDMLTAGYGVCDQYGYFEFPLPQPCEQWMKKKDFDLKVKINGMRYKVRILPFGSNELVKKNFLHYRYWDINCKNDDEELEKTYNFVVDKLKQSLDASDFHITKAVGDMVSEHKRSVYLEIVDETHPLNA